MNHDQRITDKDPLKKWWVWATPYAQVIGFVIMVAFVVGTYYSRFEAQAKELEDLSARVTNVEAAAGRVDQKLDDIIRFFGVPSHVK